jgi:hypothetical protein
VHSLVCPSPQGEGPGCLFWQFLSWFEINVLRLWNTKNKDFFNSPTYITSVILWLDDRKQNNLASKVTFDRNFALGPFNNNWVFFSFSSSAIVYSNWSTPDHLLLDSAPNLGPHISHWEINKFETCWYKSVRILEVLKLLFQQFLNLSSSQRDMNGPILGYLSNNRWLGVIYINLEPREELHDWFGINPGPYG